jgi:hypothetical protein
MYTLKLLLNAVTTELRRLSYRGVSFCVSVPKKSASCVLSYNLTPSINARACRHRCIARIQEYFDYLKLADNLIC